MTGKIRVACVGDSITYGYAVTDREMNSYPVVLAKLLGERYDVRNFGINNATLLRNGDKPYWTQEVFAGATDFAPHVVVLMLGTNDTKPQNWVHNARLEADLQAMIAHFKGLQDDVAVWVVLIPPVVRDNWGINEEAAVQLRQRVGLVACQANCPTICLSELGVPELYDADGIHPNAVGAKYLAQIVHAHLTR